MKFGDILQISFTNTVRNVKKSILSAIAIAIGVASLVIISAVGNSAYQVAESELGKLGIDGLSLRLDGAAEETLEANYAEVLEKEVEGVRVAMPFRLKYGSSQLLKKGGDTVLWGVGSRMIETMNLTLLYGREILASDLAANARVAVIDAEYAFSAYRRTNIVGKTIRISVGNQWENYEIIGIIASQTEALNAMTGGEIGAFVYIPYTTMNEATQEHGVDQIAIRCEDTASSALIAEEAEQYMARTYPTKGTFVVENITGYLEQVKGIVRLIKLLVMAIGGISLFVAGFGVMNGMLAGIAERRHEIGIYLAVGAVPRHIIESVLLEAVFLCIGGGLAGCVLGIIGSAAIGHIIGITCIPQVEDLLLGVLVSGICGMLFGTVPAIKAAHLDPIAALNRD